MRRSPVPLIISLILISLLFIIFYSELKSIASLFVTSYGFLGIFIIVVLMDTIIQPFSPDIIVFTSTLGDANLFLAALLGGLGSCIAALIGYSIGNQIGKRGFEKWFGKKHLQKGSKLFKKYGVWTVIAGALSPIPFSLVCWTAGIYKMKLNPFIVTCLLTRIPRFLIIGVIGFLM